MVVRQEMDAAAQGLRRRAEGRGRFAGEWVEPWWWKEGEGRPGLLEFEQRPAAAMAMNRGRERLRGSGEGLGRGSGGWGGWW
jgi:hypothetical protein